MFTRISNLIISGTRSILLSLTNIKYWRSLFFTLKIDLNLYNLSTFTHLSISKMLLKSYSVFRNNILNKNEDIFYHNKRSKLF